MKINHTIFKQAKKAIQEKEYEETCLQAGICPICGENTVMRRFCEIEGRVIVTGCSSCHKL